MQTVQTDFQALAHQYWDGKADIEDRDHPVTGQYPGAQELAPGLLYFKGVAAISVVDTGAGLVMLDAGTRRDADRVYDAVRAWRPDVPLLAAVYSHHHMDHIWAVTRFDTEARQRGWPHPLVHAHTLVPDHLDRYRRTAGWVNGINARQFSHSMSAQSIPLEFRFPDVTFDSHLTLRLGDLTFEMHHARGETDDHVWTWVPERRWLFPGDLFIWAVPNAGNPQKVQRYCSDWAAALRQMAGLEPEVMVCGHGMPIFGVERNQRALLDTAEYLEAIEGQTLALMNHAYSLDEILQRVTAPPHLAGRPYLQPVYDHPQFLVRNIWRRYGGWWDGEADTLLPAPRSQQAREWITLAGGVETVLHRVAILEEEGDQRLACHLIEMAVLAAPDSTAVHEARTRLYLERSRQERSTMGRGIFNHFAESSRQGLRDRLAGRQSALAQGGTQ